MQARIDSLQDNLIRLEKRLKDIETLLDQPRSRTRHETEKPHTCPSCGANMKQVTVCRFHCECGEEIIGQV